MDKINLTFTIPEVVENKAASFKNYVDALSFVIKNIGYDYLRILKFKSLKLEDTDIASTLTHKKGICFDQCVLACALLHLLGYETRLVAGTLTMHSIKAFHSWIYVKIGKEWKMCDPTWGQKYKKSDYGPATTEYLIKWVKE